jgi:hypothetical protein
MTAGFIGFHCQVKPVAAPVRVAAVEQRSFFAPRTDLRDFLHHFCNNGGGIYSVLGEDKRKIA